MDGKIHACDEPGCGKTFARPSKLRAHQLTHTSERPFVCDIEDCAKAYHRLQHLKRHQEHNHSSPQSDHTKNYFCSEDNCGASFALKQSLKKHMSRNHGDRLPYKCSEPCCSQAFRKKHQLRAHHYEHKGILPFQCEYEGCLKRFSQSSHLLSHQKQHEGYTCTEENCTLHFEKWSLLRKHIAAVHKKRFKCSQCPKTYPSKFFLKEHEASHGVEGVEMLQCTVAGCPRRYMSMRNLTAHVKSYHENKKFPCTTDSCNRAFVSKQKMLEHQKLHDPKHALKKKKTKRKTKSAASKLVDAICGNQKNRTASASVSKAPDCDDIIEYNDKQSCDDVTVDNDTRAINITIKSDENMLEIKHKEIYDGEKLSYSDIGSVINRSKIDKHDHPKEVDLKCEMRSKQGSSDSSINYIANNTSEVSNSCGESLVSDNIVCSPSLVGCEESIKKECDFMSSEIFLSEPGEILLQTESAMFKITQSFVKNSRQSM